MAWGTFNEEDNVTPGPEEWDHVFFAGVKCPGWARVAVRLASEIDERRTVEVKKSFIIDKGSKPVRVTIDIQLLPYQIAEFYSKIIPLLEPRSTSASKVPLAVSHPALLLWGVEMLMVEDIDQKPMNPGGGTLDITVSMVEYIEAPKALKKSAPKKETTETKAEEEAKKAEPPNVLDLLNDMAKGLSKDRG